MTKQQPHQLSLPLAILININIMLGTGIFVNTTVLAKRAGALGALGYIIVGFLMLPLVVSITHLLELYPAGGFYIFGRKELSPFAGFMSAWIYFTGKLASATLAIHTAVLLVQTVIPSWSSINPLYVDTVILCLFIALNMLHIRTGGAIQTLFIVFKIMPIAFILLVGVFFMQGAHFAPTYRLWEGVPSILPLVLFAVVGFEAACSLSSKIKDARKNAPRAILISYAIVITIATLFQLIFYGILGDLFNTFKDYREAFPAFIQYLLPHSTHMQQIISGILHLGIAMSALGGSYGIIFSNSWNLHTLAQHHHVFKSPLFMRLNKHQIPWLCVLVEGILGIVYIAITQGNQIPLQQMGALGSVGAYTISALALWHAQRNKHTTHTPAWLPICGLINCIMLAMSCVYGLYYSGSLSLLIFTGLLIWGIGMFGYTQKHAPKVIES